MHFQVLWFLTPLLSSIFAVVNCGNCAEELMLTDAQTLENILYFQWQYSKYICGFQCGWDVLVPREHFIACTECKILQEYQILAWYLLSGGRMLTWTSLYVCPILFSLFLYFKSLCNLFMWGGRKRNWKKSKENI